MFICHKVFNFATEIRNFIIKGKDMFIKFRTLVTLVLLSCMTVSYAQVLKRNLPSTNQINKTVLKTDAESDNWWGYFDGDYNNVGGLGLGDAIPAPATYNCAIKIPAGAKGIIGKNIKAFSFAFASLHNIADVKAWVSTQLPSKAEKADIFFKNMNLSELVTLDDPEVDNKVYLDTPYTIVDEDIYIGYSFTVTAYEDESDLYPMLVTNDPTENDALFFDFGMGWSDYSGEDYGDLAVRVLLSENEAFNPGEVNYDGKVNVADISSVVKFIMDGKVNTFNEKNADVNQDGEINVVDAAAISEIILERYEAPADKQAPVSNDAVKAVKTANGIEIALDGVNAYKAFQMDIVVPEGAEIENIVSNEAVAATHSMVYTKVADNRYRVVAFSVNGSDINASDLFSIATSADVKVENIIFATSDLRVKRFANICGDVTGIENIETENSVAEVYTIDGVKVNKAVSSLEKGVYIVNGKKVVIK